MSCLRITVTRAYHVSYHGYTCMSRLRITVTRAYHVSYHGYTCMSRLRITVTREYHVSYHGFTCMSCLRITVTRAYHVSYHGYTCMSCLPITAIRACYVYISLLHMHVMFPCDTCLYGFSIFLSYGSPCILHNSCSMFPYSCDTIVSCYWYGYSCYWTWELLICDMWTSTSIDPVILFSWYCSRSIVLDILFPIHVILFYAINRAQVQLSCYPYHVQ